MDAEGGPGARSGGRPAAGVLLAVVAVLAGAALVGVVTYALARISPETRRSFAVQPPATPRSTSSAVPLDEVAARGLDRVVTVEVAAGDAGVALGTGWLLDDHGDFVTNQHVVADQRALRLVDRQGGIHVGLLMGYDAGQDVAVVRSADGFAAAPLPPAEGPDPPLPQPVVVLASARATGHGESVAETLIRVHQPVPLDATSNEPQVQGRPAVYDDMMVLSGASVYRGNSGGPVLDDGGRVIGIVTLASERTAQAFAIPLPRVLGELRAFAARPAAG